MEDNVPPFHWPRARIEVIISGKRQDSRQSSKGLYWQIILHQAPQQATPTPPPIQSLEAALMNIERGGPDPTIHADVSTYTIKHRPPDSTTHHC